MKAAYAGAPGAFSHEACLKFLADYEPLPMPGFAAVAEAVNAGKAERGVLPLGNNGAGPVEEARKLLPSLQVIEEHWLPVRMHLLALPGVTLDEVKTAVSHPVALKQCAGTLARLGLATESATNTAFAAAALKDRTKGVLASEAAAAAYGLTIILRDVHDRADNATLFAVVAGKAG
jgi:prephenate dehydratase